MTTWFRLGLLVLGLLPHSVASAQIDVPPGAFYWLQASELLREPSKDNGPDIGIESWKDAIGQLQFVQTNAADRPRLVQIEGQSIVRFDGENDHFVAQGTLEPIHALTIVAVVAPKENLGDFRGIVAAHALQQRDYESGVNVDLGPLPSVSWDMLNVEGRGFGGARNLMQGELPMGGLHRLMVRIDTQSKKVETFIDGKKQSERPSDGKPLSLEAWSLGSRLYTNGPGKQVPRGFLKMDLAEVIVFTRALSDDERVQLDKSLEKKHQKLSDALAKEVQSLSPGKALVKVADPPPIQMLVPGFEVQELPVSLTNVNNVAYRHDGKLITLGYNGDVHVLVDTNGDGLEDKAELFWKNEGSIRGPIGMVLTPKGYSHGQGLFVASKGKVSFLVDRNGDDRADEEVVVATGWKEITQNVDATGMTLGPDGSLYFGLGTANYANGYLIGPDGKAEYDLKSERGTVQRISPDLKSRETICTGIRFPIAFSFNRKGDLFCTEQEGATWLANGNPFDELLHIQSGRHYGFPPRHPRHNPHVIDEPSTFDYGPQHQSTCGFFFNEASSAWPAFGPSSWEGDAIVCGESRGKIWRTKLSKAPAGYVASSQLIACLQMLTIDACRTPQGDMVIACHSGPPDWGTGPTGIGKLFKVRYAHKEDALPILAWPSGPKEFTIAFDRPIDPSLLQGKMGQWKLEYGDHVRAGDRFENLIPPYAVVKRQSIVPRGEVVITGIAVANDLRTIVVHVEKMPVDTHYALTFPSMRNDVDASHEEWNRSDIDTNLSGVQLDWTDQEGVHSQWIPHMDLEVVRDLTVGSEVHQKVLEWMRRPGILRMLTRLDVADLLRPKVQPGSTLDHEWPVEVPTLHVSAGEPFTLQVLGKTLEAIKIGDGYRLDWTPEGQLQENVLEIALHMDHVMSGLPKIHVAFSTSEDSRQRPLAIHRFKLPWTRDLKKEKIDTTPEKIAEIEGGSWGRGRRVFHSEAAACFKCHAVSDGGPRIGPDLGNLIHRDYASVMRDIVQPSFAINPDHIGSIVAMDDGRVLTGVLRNENGMLYLGDEKGNSTRIPRDEIQSLKVATTSIMPKGLLDKLSPDQVRDLMTYLLTPPPKMPLHSPLKAPPLRSQQEVDEVLAGSKELATPFKRLTICLIAGDKDHGPGEHDYPAWQQAWRSLLDAAPEVDVELAWGFPSDDQLDRAKMLVFFQKGTWNAERANKMDRFFAKGGGATYIHWAVNGEDQVQEMSNRIGLASRGGAIKFRHGPLTLDLHHTDHPILRNMKDHLELYDESYWLLTGAPDRITLLASSLEEGEARPQVWTYDRGQGRVFGCIPGHYSWTFDDPLFRILLLRGMAWSANEPIDRFNELVPLGARMQR